MATLRIEHGINDYSVWKAAFDRFAEARAKACVLGVAIRRPVDDPHYVMLDLEFGTPAQADAFAHFLRTGVWSSPESSPGLAAYHGVGFSTWS